MVKRAAVKDYRVAKSAKGEDGTAVPSKAVVPTDPCVEACEPLIEAFNEVDTLSEVSRDMLIAALPYVLRAPEGERHPFQANILKIVYDVFAEVQAVRRRALQVAEQALADLDAKANASEQRLEEAKAKTVAADEAREHKQHAYECSLDALAKKRKSVEEAKCKVKELDLDRKECNDKLAKFEEVLAETWRPLVAATFDNYRQRDAAVKKYFRLLDQYGDMVDSHSVALQIVFKSKPDERGEFAQMALEAAETVHAEHLDALKQTIAAFVGSPGTDALTMAEAAAAAAQTEHDAAQEASFAAQNEWAELQTDADCIKHEIQCLGPMKKKIEKDLQVAKDKLETLLQVPAKLAELHAGLTIPSGELGA